MTNKEIIRGLYESFASGDIAAVTAAFADDIAWTEADGFPPGRHLQWPTSCRRERFHAAR